MHEPPSPRRRLSCARVLARVVRIARDVVADDDDERRTTSVDTPPLPTHWGSGMAWEAIGGQKATQRLPQGGRGGFGPPMALQGTRSLALIALKWILTSRATPHEHLSLQAMP